MTIGHAFNQHFLKDSYVDTKSHGIIELQSKQKQVSILAEMVHTASLIHDDVIDGADTRRGKPTVNKRYNIHGHEAYIYLSFLFTTKLHRTVSFVLFSGGIVRDLLLLAILFLQSLQNF